MSLRVEHHPRFVRDPNPHFTPECSDMCSNSRQVGYRLLPALLFLLRVSFDHQKRPFSVDIHTAAGRSKHSNETAGRPRLFHHVARTDGARNFVHGRDYVVDPLKEGMFTYAT